MNTSAAVLVHINKPLIVEELRLPELSGGQVLVRVAYSGICHSQLNEIRGLKGEDRFLPHTLGHEGSGIVEAVGPGVSKVKTGDHAVLTWIKGSGYDVPAAVYTRSDNTRVNSGAISTFLTRAVISENRVVKIPDALGLKEAALLGCAIPTGAGIVMNTAQLAAERSIAIFGMGGIGQAALLAAKMRGAAAIIAVDVSADKLARAAALGATHTVNAAVEDVGQSIKKITQNRGVDYALECAGQIESMEAGYRCVREKGGLCIIAGNLSSGQTIRIDPFDLIKGKRILGTWGGETQPDRDIPLYADMALSGKLDLDQLIGCVFPLDRINDALGYMEKSSTGRVMIEMSV